MRVRDDKRWNRDRDHADCDRYRDEPGAADEPVGQVTAPAVPAVWVRGGRGRVLSIG